MTTQKRIESRIVVSTRTATAARRIADSSRMSLADAVLSFARGVLHRKSNSTPNSTKMRHAV